MILTLIVDYGQASYLKWLIDVLSFSCGSLFLLMAIWYMKGDTNSVRVVYRDPYGNSSWGYYSVRGAAIFGVLSILFPTIAAAIFYHDVIPSTDVLGGILLLLSGIIATIGVIVYESD